jgi:SAM-dependent methyltransferase
VTLVRGSAEATPYPEATFDVVCSQAVMEHCRRPEEVFAEFARVLRPGGHLIFLTAGRYDYVSILAGLVPNRLHGRLVEATEGRAEADTFPTYFRANSRRRVRRLARKTGFDVERLTYLNQFPYALTFSPALCRLGIWYDRMVSGVGWLDWLQGWLLGVLRRRPEREGRP